MARKEKKEEEILVKLDTEDVQSKLPSDETVRDIQGTLPLKNNDDLRQRALTAIMSRFNAVWPERNRRNADYNKFDEAWRNGDVMQDKETKARVFSPESFNVVEDWVATTMDTTFGVDPAFQVKGKYGSLVEKDRIKLDFLESRVDLAQKQQAGLLTDSEIDHLISLEVKRENKEKEQKIEAVLADNLKKTDFETTFETIAREAFKLGTFVGKITWETKENERTQTERVPEVIKIGPIDVPIPGREKTVLRTVIEKETFPKLNFVDIRNLYFREGKTKWIIESIDSTWDDIESNKDRYDNLDRAKETQYGEFDQFLQDRGSSDKKDESPGIHGLDRDVEILEGHGIPLMINGKKVNCIITVANRAEVIRVWPEKESLPYIITPFIPLKNMTTGIGVVELIEKLQSEMNTRRNQSLDANTFGLYAMAVVNMKYIKNIKDLRIRPNGVIKLKEVDRPISEIIEFIRPPVEFVQIAQGLLDRTKQDIVRTSRLKGVLSGEKITPNPTATEMASIVREALKSLKIIFRRIDRQFLSVYLQRAYQMIMYKRVKTFNVMVSESWKEITPDEIYSNGINIEMLGVTHMENDLVIRNQNMQIFDLMSRSFMAEYVNEEGVQVKPDLYRLMNEVLYSFGKERPQELWRPVGPPPQGQQPGIPAQQAQQLGGMAPQSPILGERAQEASDIIQSPVNPGLGQVNQ